MPTTENVRVRSKALPDCTGGAETPPDRIGVTGIFPVHTGVVETLTGRAGKVDMRPDQTG